MFSSPLRVDASSAYRRVRRVIAPAGESLSFVASNESNQSKDALHFAVPLRWLPSATCLPSLPSDPGTPVQRTPPLGSLRIATKHDAKRGGIGKVCEANDRIALGPPGPPSGPPFFGDFLSGKRKFAQRGVAHFAQRSYANTKVTALSGAHPDAASRSEQEVRVSRHVASIPQPERVVVCERGFDRLSPNGWGGDARNGWRCARQASTGSARTGRGRGTP